MTLALPLLLQRARSAMGIKSHAAQAVSATPTPEAATRMSELSEVWSSQLKATSKHGMESVDALTNLFADIERQLAQAIETTQQAAGSMQGDGSQGMVGAVDHARQRLNHVIGMIEEAVSANHMLFAAVTEAVQAVKELNDTAQSVEKISKMTTMLAINARIEAARAGSAGLGFAVVADEVKRLAEQSRAESQTIMDKVEKIGMVIQATADRAEALKARDKELIVNSRVEMSEVIDELGAPMTQLMEASCSLCEIGLATRGSVADALVKFQFQDRVSQRLEHVQHSVEVFKASLNRGWPELTTVEEMNQGLLASYTMPEEGRTHRQEPEPEDDDSGLVMF